MLERNDIKRNHLISKSHFINRIKELSSPICPQKVGHKINLKSIDGIKCVAFDFYGTMFISSAGDIGIDENRDKKKPQFLVEAMGACNLNILRKNVGVEGIKVFNEVVEKRKAEMKKQSIDFPEPDVRAVFYELLTKLKSNDSINGEITKDTAALCVVEFEFRSNAIWPMPGLLAHLKKLRQSDITLSIISNSQFYTPLAFKAITGVLLNDLGFSEDLQIWSYGHGVKKPSLSFYKLFVNALPKFKLKPEEVLYVGNDLFKDVIPAKKLGIKTALFVGDIHSIRHTKGDLVHKNLPDIIIDELRQIEGCVM